MMSAQQELAIRATRLLNSTRFVTLATVSPDGTAWASTVNYVVLRSPLRLLWYSMTRARHSSNIHDNHDVAGSLFRTDLGEAAPPVGLDGLQFQGTCRPLPDQNTHDAHRDYYSENFPDPEVRRQWQLPVEQFLNGGGRRFYEFKITRLWLLDLQQWTEDKVDQRVEITHLIPEL
ncbi:pyridoxamine 5'-phosphate oxidase family protein [Alloalcanivorax xenomutans]|uniref:pyridoxamine 5'-phosphate oxidase family protein n=1 Tax=Alloalcanivorax xenomutans TaxID=1094342 RepID=UPI003D9BBDBD